MHPILCDAAGHRRQPVTLPGYHAGRPPRNKGRRYPANPPTVEEITEVMRTAGGGPDAVRLRALTVVLWRAGLWIGEALALAETDLDARPGAVLVRHGKGDKRREVGIDSWVWEQLEPWQQLRVRFPVGPLFCVIHGPTAGRNREPASARRQLGRTAATAGVRRRFAPPNRSRTEIVISSRGGAETTDNRSTSPTATRGPFESRRPLPRARGSPRPAPGAHHVPVPPAGQASPRAG
jgi:integrase